MGNVDPFHTKCPKKEATDLSGSIMCFGLTERAVPHLSTITDCCGIATVTVMVDKIARLKNIRAKNARLCGCRTAYNEPKFKGSVSSSIPCTCGLFVSLCCRLFHENGDNRG